MAKPDTKAKARPKGFIADVLTPPRETDDFDAMYLGEPIERPWLQREQEESERKIKEGFPSDDAPFEERLSFFFRVSGMTQVQMAEKSGISQAQISGLLRGIFEPKLSTILALARALDISARALVPDKQR